MAKLVTIQLDFFGTPEEQETAPGAIPVEVDSVGLEDFQEVHQVLRQTLRTHLAEGDSVTLKASGDAPSGALRLVAEMVNDITHSRVVVSHQPLGHIPACVFAYTFLSPNA